MITNEDLNAFKKEIKAEKNTRELIRAARDMRKLLAAMDAEIQSRKGPSK